MLKQAQQSADTELSIPGGERGGLQCEKAICIHFEAAQKRSRATPSRSRKIDFAGPHHVCLKTWHGVI